MARLYRSGTSWCVWRWTGVRSEYITRLHLLKTPWFAVCIHWINKPDPEPWEHDHPVSFLSIVLRGWYREWRGDGRTYARRWFNWVRATDTHSIYDVSPGGALTVAFMGPKVREWGFHTPEGWVGWQAYYS